MKSLDQPHETRCLSCIRNVTAMMGIDTSKRCEGYYCGQYQISYTYWAEAGKPGNNQSSKDFERCARDRTCAEQAVKAYFKKFKRDCNNDGLIDCHDMAALHKAGPTACSADWFYKSRYWQAFNKTLCVTDRDAVFSKEPAELLDDQSRSQASKLTKNQTLTSDCLDCICDAVSGCSTSVNNCGSGTVCGPFAISQSYWKDGKRPGVSWTSCARTKECSSVTVKNYMEKYKKDCNGDGLITCEDYAAIHRSGPRACMNRDLQRDHYWNKFLSCRANQKPTHDVNLVKVGIESGEESISRVELPLSTTTTTTTTTAFPSLTSLTGKDYDQSTAKPLVPGRISSALNTNRFDYSQDSTYDLTSIGSSGKADEMDSLRPVVTNPIQPLPDYRPSVQLGPPKLPFHNRTPVSFLPTTSTTNSPPLVPAKSLLNQFKGTFFTQTPAPSLQTTTATATPLPMIPSYQTEPSLIFTSSSNGDPQAIRESSSSANAEYNPPVQLTDDIDYSPDFPSAGPNPTGNSMDKPSSFDKVVIGIVGSPDFSKSYPPIPEILPLQSKQAAQVSTGESNPDVGASSLVVKSQQRITTNHSRANAKQPSPHSSTVPPSSNTSPQAGLAHTKTSDFQQRISSTGTAVNQQPVTAAGSEPVDRKNEQTLPTLISGPDSINMSSLFDGGLNESSRISSECLECICDASSNCDTTVQCISKQREKNRCGLYMISWNQFQDSDIALTSLAPVLASTTNEDTVDEKLYYDCTTDRVCAEKLIHLYIEKYQKDCNNDGRIDCYDIAAIHRVGPDQCNSGKFLSSQYWKDFNICYTSDRLTTPTTILP